MSERRQLWETLAAFLAQLEKEADAAGDIIRSHPPTRGDISLAVL